MRYLMALCALLLCVTQADARPRHHHRHHHHHHSARHTVQTQEPLFQPFDFFQATQQPTTPTTKLGKLRRYDHSVMYLPHPSGCPSRNFCACGAAKELFGRPIRALWPTSAWFKFPRVAPGRNTVAVRHGHLFVLKKHESGDMWWVNDYNSGGHRSRYHLRSIRGYRIVDPMSMRGA